MIDIFRESARRDPHLAARFEKDIAPVLQEDYRPAGEVPAVRFDDLTGSDELPWADIGFRFRTDFRKFNALLKKIHFNRSTPLQESQRKRLLTFLAAGYYLSGDVRYFNEFLWFHTPAEQLKPAWHWTLNHFLENMASTRHPFPIRSAEEPRADMMKMEETAERYRRQSPGTSVRVGLMGSPTFFTEIFPELERMGFSVRCYFVPWHPRKMANFVFKHRILFRLFCRWKRVDFTFTTIHEHPRSKHILDILQKEALDIGFHKLGFIIRRNIIDAFRIGLINDHWGLLPYVRGRSTLEYSILHGFPVAASTHLVTPGVDRGDIIAVYGYDHLLSKAVSIRALKNAVRAGYPERAVDSIRILSAAGGALTKNDAAKGLTFYSMHPALVRYIEKRLLKARR